MIKKKLHCCRKKITTGIDGFEITKRILLVIIFVCLVLSSIIYKNKGKHLQEETKTTIGWVYEKEIRNGLRYSFVVHGEEYHGSSSFIGKRIGDTIRVYYFPDDPNNNRSWKDYYEIIKED